MNFDPKEFLEKNVESYAYSAELQALWHDARGDWSAAHALVDGPPGQSFARVHAYLHRKEGDLWNADYWYRRAGESRPNHSLEEEWRQLCERFYQG
ncbi:hypothetical protein [Algoriphagus namhaensis]